MFDTASPDTVRQYLLDLQSRITGAVAAMDGGSFVVDPWHKAPQEPLQGNGITQILENGAVFERAAVFRMCAVPVCHRVPPSTAPNWRVRPLRPWASRWYFTPALLMPRRCT